jgi:hypothetical protein
MKINSFFFEKYTPGDELQLLRNQYLDRLSHPQEYYVELEIQKAIPYIIRLKDSPIGYFFLTAKKVLLEFYIIPEWINQNDTIFGEIIQKFGIKTAWCKS